MELIAILLSSVLGAISSTGLILDRVVENNLRDSVESVEKVAVRIDNTPSYQVIQGKVDRIRIAMRGVEPIPHLRIDTLELETDPIDVNLSSLQGGGIDKFRESLRQPLQGAVRLAISEADINRALQTPSVQSLIQQAINRLVPDRNQSSQMSFSLVDSRLDFLENDRLGVRLNLQSSNGATGTSEALEIILEVGFRLVNGRSIQLIEPEGTINGRRLSNRLLQGFAERLSQELDLRTLDKQGTIARLLQLETDGEKLNLAAFVRVETLNPADPIEEQ